MNTTTTTVPGTNGAAPNAAGRMSDHLANPGNDANRNQDAQAAYPHPGAQQADANKSNGAPPANTSNPANATNAANANKQVDANKPGDSGKSAGALQPSDKSDANSLKSGQLVATAANELANLRADLDSLISRIPHLAEAELNVAKDALLQKYSEGKKTVANATTAARETLNHGMEVAGDYVKDRPLKTVAVTGGIGILIGMLIGRGR